MTNIYGTNSSLLIIGDADILIAFTNIEDVHYEKVHKLFSELYKKDPDATIVFPTTALSEAVTVLCRRLNNPRAAESILNQFNRGLISLIEVDEAVVIKAQEYFSIDGSKKDTFFDAIVCAITYQHDADAIFSFDKGYTKKGFTLLSDLFTV